MILVVGDVMVDVFLIAELQASEQTSGLAVRGGGSAANTAAWVASTGHAVALTACTGDDAPGRMLISELHEQGVETAEFHVPDLETGVVLVRLDAQGERVMRSSRGANMALSPEMIAAAGRTELSAVHITGYALLNRYKLDLLSAAARVAHDHGAILSFDPSSIDVVRTLGRNRLRDALATHGVDVLLPNAEEARALADMRDIDMAARELTTVVPAVLVKTGRDGAVVFCDEGVRHVPTRDVMVVDTTGAGDAFNAGALVALVTGLSRAEACRRGNELARRAVQFLGGRPTRRL